MKCPKCGSDNKEGRKFCSKCGTKLEISCPKCGFMNDPDDAFCGGCGEKLGEAKSIPQIVEIPSLQDMYAQIQHFIPKSIIEKMRLAEQEIIGENRQVTALFADISGFTDMSQRLGSEATVEKVNQCCQEIVDAVFRHGGNVNRYIGDCVLALFGAPIAHENDPERAILSALDMREAVSQLELSISVGINTGMMYFGTVGAQQHQEISAYGNDINLAKRLQETADAGHILVGGSTHRLTRRAFEFQPAQPLTVKGFAEPISAYEVVKSLPKPEKIRGIEGLRAEMIGRDKELSDLKECVDELLAGRGQIASIIGEAGVGKSRLATELKEYLKEKMKDEGKRMTNEKELHPLWLEGRCVSIGESVGYWVFVDILRDYLGFSENDSLEECRSKIIEKMQMLFPQRWEEIVPYLGNLLSVRFEDEKIKYLPAEQLKYQTFLTLRDIFLAIAQQSPILLIFEDLHWADNLSLDVINLLMDTLTIAPIMLLCIYRPEKEHRSWLVGTQASSKCLDRYTEINLRPLNHLESRRLVESLLTIDNLPETVKEMILQKSEGNPFFVEEVIRSLIESGVVYRDSDRWIAKEEVENITVPDTIQSVIMARIDRLEEEVRYVLQSASVIGRLFRYRLLQYTTHQENNLDNYMWKLEEGQLIYEEHAIPELEYSFKHVLTQETAYNTILSRRKKEFHRKVAEGYEALYSSRLEEYYDELAYHYSRSDNKEKALDYLVKAGNKAKEDFSNDQAISYYNQALKLMEDGSEPTLQGHIYQNLGEIYLTLLKYEESLECCSKALEYNIDKRKRANIYKTMGYTCEEIGKLDQALEYINLGIAELGDDTESPEMAKICIIHAWILFHKVIRALKHDEDQKEAEETALRGLKIVEGTTYYSEIVNSYDCLLFISEYSHFDIDKSLEYAEKALEIAKKSGNSLLIANSIFNIGWVYMRAGFRHIWENGYDIAIKYVKESAEIYERIGNSSGIGTAYYHIWFINNEKGNKNEAIQWLERSLKFPEHSLYLFFAHHLAGAYFNNGNIEKAVETCKVVLEYLKDNDALAKAMVGFSLIDSPISVIIGNSLSIMEEAYSMMGKQAEFILYCKELKEKNDYICNLKPTQWYLEPTEISDIFAQVDFIDEFDSQDLKSEWEWINPTGDSSYNFSSESGWLELHANSGSDLYAQNLSNLNAPRLLQEISGNFAIETKIKSSDLSMAGGFLVWKDDKNFIRFERRENQIGLEGYIHDGFNRFGRGMLTSDITYFRLERIEDNLKAYCSEDGINWFTAGEVSFPIDDPIRIGIHVLGRIDFVGSTGTATKFDYFKVMRIIK